MPFVLWPLAGRRALLGIARLATLGVVIGATLALVASSPLPGQRASEDRGLWVLTSDRLLELGPAGELRIELPLAEDFAPAGAQALSIDAADGTVWLLGADRVLGYSASGSLIARFEVSEIARSRPAAPVRFLAHGRRLWLGVAETLFVLARHGELEATLYTGSPVRDLVAERGAVWALTELDVQRFEDERLARTLTLPIALEGAPRIAIDPSTGGLWIATEAAVELYDTEGELLLHREHDPPLASLAAVMADHRGGLWSASGRRLVRMSAAGEIAPRIFSVDTPGNIRTLAHDPRADRLWVATDQQLFSMQRSGARSTAISFEGESPIRALAFAAARGATEPAADRWQENAAPALAAPEAGERLELVSDPRSEMVPRAAEVCGGRFSHDLIPGSGAPFLTGAPFVRRRYVVFDDGSGPALYTTHHEYIGRDLRGRLVRLAGDHWENASEVFFLRTRFIYPTGERPAELSSLAVFDDGSGPALYVAGLFDDVGEVKSLGSVARWDGRRWSKVGLGLGIDRVLDLRVFDDGSGPALYAQGLFDTANWVGAWHGSGLRVPVNGNAKWDGRVWSASTPMGEVVTVRHPAGTERYGIVTQPDHILWVARWTGAAFEALPRLPGAGSVATFAAFDDGAGEHLYVPVDTSEEGRVYRWDGATWSALPGSFSGALGQHGVGDLEAWYGEGSPQLVAAGSFDAVGGTPVAGIARWDGTSWSSMGERPNGNLTALELRGTPLLLADGGLHWTGSAWVPITGEPGIDGDVDALASFAGDIYIGGSFDAIGGVHYGGFARWDGARFGAVPGGLTGRAEALIEHAGELVAAGALALPDGTPVRAAAWDGVAWAAVDAGLGGPVQEFGRIEADVVAGTTDGVYLRSGASWQRIGSSNGAVRALAGHDDGTGPALWAAGAFSQMNGSAARGIARWDAAGWSDARGGVLSGDVLDLAVSGGELFAATSGAQVWRLAGGEWQTVGKPLLAVGSFTKRGEANLLAAFDDGGGEALYVGGLFWGDGDFWFNNLARLEAGEWRPLPGRVNGRVLALAPFWEESAQDGQATLMVGGSFSRADGSPSARLAQWRQAGCTPGPAIELESPVDGALTNQPLQPFRGALDQEARLEIAGAPVALRQDLSFDHGPLELAPGENLFDLEATNPPGATTEMRVGVTLDSEPPSLDFESPHSGTTVTSGTPQLALRYRDELSGPDPATLRVEVGGAPLAVSCSARDERAVCTPAQPLPSGPVTLRVQIADRAGNDSAPATVSFVVDTAVPATTSIQGRVLKDDGSPAPGARVRLRGGNGGGGETLTQADGSFLLAGIDASRGELLTVTAAFRDGTGPPLFAYARDLLPVPGGVIDAGVLRLDRMCPGEFARDLFGGVGVDRTVYALALFDDGRGEALYVGGDFDYAGGVIAENLARWDGERWEAVAGGADFPVRHLAVLDLGDGLGPTLFAAGGFETIGGAAAKRVARFDGARWRALGSGLGRKVTLGNTTSTDLVYDLELYDDGRSPALYATGTFSEGGDGLPIEHLARWNGSTWEQVGGGLATTGRALAVYDDGRGRALYVGGDFDSAGGLRARRLARWNGSTFEEPDFGLSDRVHALAVFDDGRGEALYVGGDFFQAGPTNDNFGQLARWDGVRWSGVDQGVRVTAPATGVRSLLVLADEHSEALLVGGQFDRAGDVPVSNLARWDGGSWSPVSAGTDGTVYALAVAGSGEGAALFAGGSFALAGELAVDGITRFTHGSFAPLGSGLDGEVMALASFDDGTGPALYAGGKMARASGNAVGRLARWDGRGWSAVGAGLDASVSALLGIGSSLYAGGEFLQAGGAPAARIARWTGGVWQGLGTGLDAPVRVLAAFDDGTGLALYAGGELTLAGGTPANRIARWNGSAWSPLGSGVNGAIRALAVFDDGNGTALYAGGAFTTAGGAAANRIARWNGSSWSPLGSGLDGAVRALLVFDDGTGPALYAGGEFKKAGGKTSWYLARWDGAAWSTLGNLSGAVSALHVYDDGTGAALYTTGEHWSVPGVTTRYVARWDGQAWSALGGGVTAGLGNIGNALAVHDDGEGPALFVGGRFTRAGGQPSAYLARWRRPLECVDVTPPELAIAAPAPESAVASAQPEIRVAYSDEQSGVDVSTLRVEVTGLEVAIACTAGSAEATCAPSQPLPQGSIELVAQLADLEGNTATARSGFVVDTQAPSVEILAPQAGALLLTGRPEVVLAHSDIGSGVDRFVIDLATNVAIDCVQEPGITRCTPRSHIGDGPRTLRAWVFDRAGNQSPIAQAAIVIDTVAPAVSFRAPAAGAVVTTAFPGIELRLVDLGGVVTETLAVTANGADLALHCSFALPTALCRPVAPLAAGAVTLTARITDVAGRPSNVAQLAFTVDPRPPVVEFLAPAEGAVVASTTPRVELRLPDQGNGIATASLRLSAGGSPLPANCIFSLPLAVCTPSSPLPLGTLVLGALVEDTTGQVGAAEVTITVDPGAQAEARAPVISIRSPRPAEVWSAGTGTIRVLFGDQGTGIDGASLSFTANGVPFAATCRLCPMYADCVPAEPLTDPAVTLAATVRDRSGNLSQAARVLFATDPDVDVTAPFITLLEPKSGVLVTEDRQRFRGNVSEPSVLTIDGEAVALQAHHTFDHTITLAEGRNLMTLVATDPAGNQGALTVELTLDTTPPQPIDPSRVTVSAASGGRVSVSGSAGAVAVTEPGLEVGVTNVSTGARARGAVAANGSFTVVIAAEGGDGLRVAVFDPAGNASPARRFVVPGTVSLPPDPATLAPAPDPTIAADLYDSTRFLYEGQPPVQVGVEPGAIDPRRVAVLRGRALDRQGQPLAGVSISVRAHPELGRTWSRADGRFDLVVNGGSALTVDYVSAEHLPVQRTEAVPWRDWVAVPDVVMTSLDAQVTAVAPAQAADVQVARGSPVSDADGERQATLLFFPGTEARARYEGGGSEPLSALSVRATEYTAGPGGRAAMPGPLPPASLYTYAVDFTVDEALENGASRVDFTRPVASYTENFLDLPAGTVIPVGYYDREQALWVAAKNGRVIAILSEQLGLAVLDVDGSGQAASAAALSELGITGAEQAQLAQLYTPGQSLWRVSIEHFTPYDFNLAFEPDPETGDPADAEPPEEEPPKGGDEDKKDKPCLGRGSIIECENQILGEAVGIAGTPFTLHYQSDRVPGRKAAYDLDVSLAPAELPSGLRNIQLEIDVAGQRLAQEFAPEPSQRFHFTWDGTSAWGQKLQGRQPYEARIGYSYKATYNEPPEDCEECFALPGTGPITGDPARGEVTFWQAHSGRMGAWDALDQLRLGGWSLSVHHVYDPYDKTLYYGDGRRRRITNAQVITSVVGTGARGVSNGVPAEEALLDAPDALDVCEDGSILFLDWGNCRLQRVRRDGILETLAGTDCSAGPLGDGNPAVAARLLAPSGFACQPGGEVYIADTGHHIIRRVDPQGVITTIAGYPPPFQGGRPGDTPATAFFLDTPSDVEIGPDGAAYIATNDAVYRLDLENLGTAQPVVYAGGGIPVQGEEFWTFGNGRFATEAWFKQAEDLEFSPDGELHIAESFSNSIWRVAASGRIYEVAGGWNGETLTGYEGDGDAGMLALLNDPRALSFDPYGVLYFADTGNHVIRRIDRRNVIKTVAGTGVPGYNGNDRPATQTQLSSPFGVAMHPAGGLLVSDTGNNRVRQLDVPVEGGATSVLEIRIPSEDGSVEYVFTGKGKHLRTEDPDTGQVLMSFSYDAAGLLERVSDAFGNVTRIVRHGNGDPQRIIAPFGQETELEVHPDGYLAAVENAAGERVEFPDYEDGLLRELRDPNNNLYRFEYDEQGRLVRDADPEGGFTELVRTESGQGRSGHSVEKRTALGRSTVYEQESLPTGEKRSVTTLPDGTQNVLLIGTDGKRTVTYADGTVATMTETADARFGMKAPRVQDFGMRTPGGLEHRTATEQEVATAPDGKVTKMTTRVTTNGRTTTTVRDLVARTVTTTSPGGRVGTSTYDVFGRITKSEFGGLEPIHYTYDARGRLSRIRQDTRNVRYFYDSATGYLESIRDPLNREVHFSYDAAGRVLTQTLPDLREIGFDYDRNGNVTAITPPSRPDHEFGYTKADLPEEYTPPEIDAGPRKTILQYNEDQQVTQIDRPDSQSILYDYDPASGRLERVTTPRGDYVYHYDEATSNVARVEDPDGGSLEYTYDGSLPLTVTWSGEIEGSIEQVYNDDLRVEERTVNGEDPVAFEYDVDGFLVQAGELELRHRPADGFLEGTTLGDVTDEYDYNAYGEVKSYEAQYRGSDFYQLSFTRDALGRITRRRDWIQGVGINLDYRYDDAGRLDKVLRAGAVLADYDYDGNGNRIAWRDQISSGTATYDAQDRLLTYGPATYTYNANGDLESKTVGDQTITYQYDVSGNLRRVVLVSGIEIDYVIDAANRRVGKKINSELVKAYLYADQLNPIAELDPSTGEVLTRFIYASSGHVPDTMVRDEITYRLISDHMGSVRLVVNVLTGAIVQRTDYDAFGRILQDTNPGFQPFGFAGGVYDHQTGLVRFGARDYDSETGRWTSKDPIGFSGGDANLYGYVVNDPVNLTDPSGKILPLLALAWGVAEIGLSVYDVVDAVRTVLSDCAPGWSKGLAVGGAVAGIFLPGGGYDDVVEGGIRFSRFTARNFRKNLGMLTGGVPNGYHAHHVFPRQFARIFQRLGVDVHHPRHGVWWEATNHLRNASQYNAQWQAFLRSHPSAEEAVGFARQLANNYGFILNF